MPVPRRLLILMARAPAPLGCKTRLASGGLGPRRAALVQARLLDHTLTVVTLAATQLDAHSRLALAGGAARQNRSLPGLCTATQLVDQGCGSLGLRMQRQFARGFAQGYRSIVLVGSDLPRLSVSDLHQAVASLQQVPLVLGPAEDGGYWLIGLRAPAAALFAGIDWGGAEVLAQTLLQARRLALPLTLLGYQGDLDRTDDLALWR